MGTFTIILLCIYLVYYLGNITYDLFLKKDMVKEESSEVEMVLPTITDTDSVQKVSMDDVQDIRTPSAFETEDPLLDQEEEIDEDRNEKISEDKDEAVIDPPSEDKPELNKQVNDLEEKHKERMREREFSKKRFKELQLEAMNTVQVVDTIGGRKIYSSTLHMN